MVKSKTQIEVRQDFLRTLENVLSNRERIEETLASDPRETHEAFQRLFQAASVVRETLQAPVNSATIFDSASLILGLSRGALVATERQPVRLMLEGIVEESNTLEKSSIRLLDQGETFERTLDYYKALTDIEIVSQELHQMGKIIGQKEDRSVFDMLKGYIESIASFIKKIGVKLKSVIFRWDEELLAALNDLKQGLKESIDKVADKFRLLVDRFHSFTIHLIGRTFDFLGEIGKIATEKKFSVSEITLEVPSYEFEIVMVGVPIPVPRVKSPKLTIKFKPVTTTLSSEENS